MKSLLHAVMAARGTDKLWHQVMDRPESEENYANPPVRQCSSTGWRRARLGLCGAKEEAAARESMDALWAQTSSRRRTATPELTRICKVAAGRGAVSRRQL